MSTSCCQDRRRGAGATQRPPWRVATWHPRGADAVAVATRSAGAATRGRVRGARRRSRAARCRQQRRQHLGLAARSASALAPPDHGCRRRAPARRDLGLPAPIVAHLVRAGRRAGPPRARRQRRRRQRRPRRPRRGDRRATWITGSPRGGRGRGRPRRRRRRPARTAGRRPARPRPAARSRTDDQQRCAGHRRRHRDRARPAARGRDPRGDPRRCPASASGRPSSGCAAARTGGGVHPVHPDDLDPAHRRPAAASQQRPRRPAASSTGHAGGADQQPAAPPRRRTPGRRTRCADVAETVLRRAGGRAGCRPARAPSSAARRGGSSPRAPRSAAAEDLGAEHGRRRRPRGSARGRRAGPGAATSAGHRRPATARSATRPAGSGTAAAISAPVTPGLGVLAGRRRRRARRPRRPAPSAAPNSSAKIRVRVYRCGWKADDARRPVAGDRRGPRAASPRPRSGWWA